MPILTAGKTKNRGKGYAYLMLLVAAASGCLIASLFGVMALSRAVKVEKENELIFRGLAYADAIRSYYMSSKGKKSYPVKLEYLLSDPRFSKKKHIRKLYYDPVTRGEWTLIVQPDGGITGIASRSNAKPVKQSGFPEKLRKFEGVEHYSDWVFLSRP
jgi:hypothetical protein